MAAVGNAMRQSFVFRDMKNQTARTQLYYPGAVDTPLASAASSAQALAHDLLAITQTQYVTNEEGAVTQVRSIGPDTTVEQAWLGYTAAPGDYSTVEDKLVLMFADQANKTHRLQIPCPLVSVFLADKETADFTNAGIKQVVADILFTPFGGTNPAEGIQVAASSAQGNLFLVVQAGFRLRRRMQRRFNNFSRNPTLTGQGL